MVLIIVCTDVVSHYYSCISVVFTLDFLKAYLLCAKTHQKQPERQFFSGGPCPQTPLCSACLLPTPPPSPILCPWKPPLLNPGYATGMSKSFGSVGLMCTFTEKERAEYVNHKNTKPIRMASKRQYLSIL